MQPGQRGRAWRRASAGAGVVAVTSVSQLAYALGRMGAVAIAFYRMCAKGTCTAAAQVPRPGAAPGPTTAHDTTAPQCTEAPLELRRGHVPDASGCPSEPFVQTQACRAVPDACRWRLRAGCGGAFAGGVGTAAAQGERFAPWASRAGAKRLWRPETRARRRRRRGPCSKCLLMVSWVTARMSPTIGGWRAVPGRGGRHPGRALHRASRISVNSSVRI